MNKQPKAIFVIGKQAWGISGNIPESSLLIKHENNQQVRHLLFLAEYTFLQQQVFLKFFENAMDLAHTAHTS